MRPGVDQLSKCVYGSKNFYKKERHSKEWSHLQVRWKVKGKDLRDPEATKLSQMKKKLDSTKRLHCFCLCSQLISMRSLFVDLGCQHRIWVGSATHLTSSYNDFRRSLMQVTHSVKPEDYAKAFNLLFSLSWKLCAHIHPAVKRNINYNN